MKIRSQLWLPKLTEFERVSRSNPQPRIRRQRPLKKYEILYHPFDLRFRGRIGNWIQFLEDSKKVNPTNNLSESDTQLIKLYFYPQGKSSRWLNQGELSKKLPDVKYWNFRNKAVLILTKIWQNTKS